jgi:outer membrane protein assembly factor BamB
MFTANTDSGGGTEKHPVFIILLCALAAVLVFVIPWRGAEGVYETREREVVLNQAVPAQTPPVQTHEVPRVWPQSGFSAQGNPAWGTGIREPFQLKWQLRTDYEFFSSPVLLDNTLYVGCNDMRFRALNAETGAVEWSHTVVCGLSGGAAGDERRIWFGGQDGRVYCLDRETGALVWSTGLGYHIFSDAALFQDTIVLAGNSMGAVAALNAETGNLLWSHTLGGLVLGPAVSDSIAVFVTESGCMAAYSPDGETLWNRSFASQPSPPTISNSKLFAGFSSGKVLAFNLNTGATIWETQLPNIRGRTLLSRPVSAGSSILVGTCDSRLVSLDGETGAIVWETAFENWVQVPSTVCDTLVYVPCDDGRLHILSLNTGERLYAHEIEGYSGTQPIVSGGMVYLGTANGGFMALTGTIPTDDTP